MTKSAILFSEAQEVIVGGVNSPVRSFRGVGGVPVYIDHAKGPYMYDVEGKQYIDYIGSWGPMIVGHAHKDILAVINKTAAKGISFGAPTEIETLMAKRICQLVPSIEQVRMVSSGTEATMSAIRMARAYTQRDKIVKFEGCYHGHSDSLLVQAGSGALTLGVPSSPGVPLAVAKDTLTLSYNDSATVKRTFAQIGTQIAAIIVEPVAGNMNCIIPVAGFLETLREVCDQYASILIFDEVMTGFRVHKNCAQGLYNIKPDLTTLGKIIGGGMPVGAFGGAYKIMSSLAPVGPVYQAGTLSGNPLAMSAGYKTLELLSAVNFYQQLAEKTRRLATGIQAKAVAAGIGMSVNVVGSMFGLFFSQDEHISCLAQVMRCDQAAFKQFFHGMLNEGVYLAPSAFEAGFVSSAHSDADIAATIAAAGRVFDQM